MKFPVSFMILLVVGLIIGVGVGSMVSPQIVTSTQTLLKTETLTEKMVEKVTEIRTEKLPTIFYSTLTRTVREVSTSTVTKTTTSVAFSFSTVTLTKKIYPSETETILVTESGSGYKDARPFTLNETSDLKITVKIYPTADLKYVSFHWYLVPVGLERYQAMRDGSINQEAGTHEFYLAMIPPGNYYITILSANCKWEMKTEIVKSS